MQPRYVRIDARQAIDAGHRTGGCAACGWFGALAGPHHNTAECLACGTVTCEGLHSTCRVCHYGLFKRMTSLPCGYKGCTSPAVAEAPRVRRVCKDHMQRAKVRAFGKEESLADYVFREMTERWVEWVLFPGAQK
jgi:hypothetical protein